MEGKLFIAFVSMVILSRIRMIASGDTLLRDRSVTEIIREMKLLRRIDLEGRKSPLYTPRTKLQKRIIETFGIPTAFDDTEPVGDESEIVTSEEV